MEFAKLWNAAISYQNLSSFDVDDYIQFCQQKHDFFLSTITNLVRLFQCIDYTFIYAVLLIQKVFDNRFISVNIYSNLNIYHISNAKTSIYYPIILSAAISHIAKKV